MSETVKGYQRGEIVRGEHPVNVTTFVSLNDYAALSKRLAETEAIAKSLLDKAPAQADEMRRMGAQVVELTKALDQLLDHYLSLVASGDAGYWDAEDEVPVKRARLALGRPAPTKKEGDQI